MDLTLETRPDELREKFYALRDPRDVADMLGVPYASLNYWTYATTDDEKYTTFHIAKKSGGHRQIDAPNKNIKILQQKLNTVLQSVYRVKPSAHGFASGKSVKTNALRHVKQSWVLNLDLDNFFHTIHFGRVRGMFMASPYKRPEQVATILANLCCHQGHLPQGAPTSPVISNMICAKMDSQLQQLARHCRSWYTRYADDITFSTGRREFPVDLAFPNELGQVQTGHRLNEIIGQNGFVINGSKVRLRGRNQRQEVTGVTVNDIPNVPKRFTNQVRAMLHVWGEHGLSAAQQTWEEKIFHKHIGPGKSTPRFEQVVKGKIEYLGMIKGQDSRAYLKFLDQLWELDPDLAQGRGTPLHLLLRRYDELANRTQNTQRRGYDLENLMYDLFDIAGIEARRPFRRNQGGEQIDGAFELSGTDYLLECKWTVDKTEPAEISEFSGKLSRSGGLTMGMVVTVNGWSDNVVALLKQNTDKRTFLMNGEDLRTVLAGRVSLSTMLQGKRRALNLAGEPFVPVDQLIKFIDE